ncbi:MAG: hypothetical protein U0T83_04070 [Bacteriovoracaceae bacterium]
MLKLRIRSFTSIGILAMTLSGCGNDKAASTTATTSTSSSSTSSAFPSGLSVASTFADTTNSKNNFLLEDDFVRENYNEKGLFATESFEDMTVAEQTATLSAIVTADQDTDCQISLPSISSSVEDTSCYGPALDYSNHPNATSYDANSTLASNSEQDDGRLPTGDLGLWSATDTNSSSACAAAKVNSLVSGIGDKVGTGLLFSAGVNCVLTRNSISLPTVANTPVDVTNYLATPVAVNNTTTTITSATVTKLDDVNSNSVYQYYIYFTQGTKSAKIYLKHMSTSTSNATYMGKIWSSVEGASGGAGDSFAYSLLYEKASSTSTKYILRGTSYNKNSSSPHPTSLFTNGNLNLTASSLAGNMTQLIANIDPSTGYGNVSYSWQAGSGDSNSRVFNTFTNSTQGCGFFGFGGSFSTTNNTFPDNTITTFICNWAGPGNSHTGISGKAQKQCMTVGAGGLYQDTASKQSITYAPTNSCDFNGSTTNGSNLGFNWGLQSGSNSTDYTTFGNNFSPAIGTPHASVTNNLVTLTSDTDYASYSAPVAPTAPSTSF